MTHLQTATAPAARHDSSRRAFGAPELTQLVVLAAGCAWLFLVPGRGLWATADDWMLIGTRDWSVIDLLTDHNQHLSLFPVLVYKGLFDVIGFNPYWPYQVIAAAMHIVIVLLVRTIMVRGGVNRWVATMCASALILVQGEGIVVSQFQMTMALALMLVAVLVAMDEASSLGLVVGIVCTVVALGSSGVAVPLVAAVAAIAWRRQGVRRAVALVAPSSLLYLAWWLTMAPRVRVSDRQDPGSWLISAAWHIITALTGTPWSGLLLIGAILAGWVLATFSRRAVGPRVLEPATLAVTAGILLVLTYIGRGFWPPEGAAFARFAYLGAALMMPAIGYCTEHLRRLHTALLLLVGVPLAVGAAVNLQGWQSWGRSTSAFMDAQKSSVAAVLRSPAGATATDSIAPYLLTPLFGTGDAPWSFLRTVTPEKAGLAGITISRSNADVAALRLRLADRGPADATARCRTTRGPQTMTLRNGDPLGFRWDPTTGSVLITPVLDGQIGQGSLELSIGSEGRTLEMTSPPGEELTVQVQSSGGPTTVCR